MILLDDNSNLPPEQPREADSSASPSSSPAPSAIEPFPNESSAPLTGDPISYAATIPVAALKPRRLLPEDLRISWSWPHFLIFVLFALLSQVTIAVAILGYYSAARHFNEQQMKHVLEDPKLLVGTNVLWFGLVMLFLYITLGVLRGLPFWQSLGWRKLNASPQSGRGRPWMYFLAGCGLAMFVAFASAQVKTKEHMPIQDLFKNQTGALLLMGMAVLVAPLVEETMFRGYLYPTLVRVISGVVRFIAADFTRATRISLLISFATIATHYAVFHRGQLALSWGVFSLLILVGIIFLVILTIGKDSARVESASVFSSIILTGTLFGLMHAPQLGWTWGLVSLLTLVGVIFTFARAWTGTVVASFLLHLGYNSFLAVTSIIATHGFTHMPHGQ